MLFVTIRFHSKRLTHDYVIKWTRFLRFCPLAGNLPVTGEYPSQRPVTLSFDIFYDLRLNKRLSKQSWGWLFETPLRPLWGDYNVWKKSIRLPQCQCNSTNICKWIPYEGLLHTDKKVTVKVKRLSPYFVLYLPKCHLLILTMMFLFVYSSQSHSPGQNIG